MCGWMMEDMEASLDPSQFGKRKGRSACHYIVNLVHPRARPTHIPAGVDYFNKAFAKVNPNITEMQVRAQVLPCTADSLSYYRQ